MPATRFRGGEIYGIRIPTVFSENDAIRCEGCGEHIDGTPFRVSIMDIVAPEAPPSWAVGAKVNPGPHQFHADGEHVKTWARRQGYFWCRLSAARELMRPIPIPGDEERWGLCDALHPDDHQLVPA
jgi:hypothetical protein